MATMEITTMIGCPVMCTFCPQDPLKASYGVAEKYLSIRSFESIIEKLPNYVRIDFSGFSEPWANPNCNEFLRIALEQNRNVAIYTTLYGMDGPSAKVATQLLSQYSHQVETLVLHVQDKNENMRGLKFRQEWVDAFREFVRLFGSGVIKDFQFMTMDKGGTVHPALANVLPKLHSFRGHDRAGSLPQGTAEVLISTQGLKTKSNIGKRIICKSTPYYDHNVVLPNGDVYLCCMDYSLKNRLGNLLESDYESLFNSSELHYVRFNNMVPGEKISICHKCDNILCV